MKYKPWPEPCDRRGAPWSAEEQAALKKAWKETNLSIQQIAHKHGRTCSGIEARLQHIFSWHYMTCRRPKSEPTEYATPLAKASQENLHAQYECRRKQLQAMLERHRKERNELTNLMHEIVMKLEEAPLPTFEGVDNDPVFPDAAFQ